MPCTKIPDQENHDLNQHGLRCHAVEVKIHQDSQMEEDEGEHYPQSRQPRINHLKDINEILTEVAINNNNNKDKDDIVISKNWI